MHHKAAQHTVVSVTPSSKHPAWMFGLSPDQILKPIVVLPDAGCRQQLPPAYALNGALYMSSSSSLERERSFLNADTLGYVMPTERSLDIDTLLDWQWGEFLMQKQF
jgi:CMP-N-acetylneuraminic acid synthetase